ncbi:succinate dehydrogenase assembly factor 2, mitochondrial [Hydra vulgaris]|uniref:Succinate dehydrogenase assembly factor 2, mitochondrial n=1 Tax=Hydra vulgaris TaxID=6087 RepID=A0ABM4CU58_HYDVU
MSFLLRRILFVKESQLKTLKIFFSSNPIDFPDMGPPIPEYKKRYGEADDVLRSRLLYQSRKRGMSENGLLLSTFASSYLNRFTRKQLEEFDKIINQPSNDWDIFYWILGKKETPDEYNSEVMDLLKSFSRNQDMEARYRQPDLIFETRNNEK